MNERTEKVAQARLQPCPAWWRSSLISTRPTSLSGAHGPVDPAHGERLQVLQDDQVRFFGQPVAVVIAETLDQAKRSGFRLAWSGADEHVTRASPTGDEAWHTTSR